MVIRLFAHFKRGKRRFLLLNMGCGSSRGSRVVSPLSKYSNNSASTHAWAERNGGTKTALEKRGDSGIQVVHDSEWEDREIQTDSSFFSMNDESTAANFVGWPMNGSSTTVETQTYSLTSVNGQQTSHAHAQTDQRILMTNKKTSSDMKVQTDGTITMESSCQTYRARKDHCTQTGSNQSSRQSSEYSGESTTTTTTTDLSAELSNASQKSPFQTFRQPLNVRVDSYKSDIMSENQRNFLAPIGHIEKELNDGLNGKVVANKQMQETLLNRLLEDVEGGIQRKRSKSLTTVGTQTVTEHITTEESSQFSARPPPCSKREMLPNVSLMHHLDEHALTTPESVTQDVNQLVNHLVLPTENDLQKVRVLFRWITHNIRFDWKFMDEHLSTAEVVKQRTGTCKDYVNLFNHMCKISGVRVKNIKGYARGNDFRPGHRFEPGIDRTHAWNAVFIFGSWRLIDCTWGTGFNDNTGKFHFKLNEHYFLTDPAVMIWTHFPYDDIEPDYSRWQLLEKPFTLEQFNQLPRVTPHFFDCKIKIRYPSPPKNPITFKNQVEIKLASHDVLRYKYKCYPTEEIENTSMNHFVFCQLKEDRLVGSFAVSPPIEGRYYLKIYARSEKELTGDDSNASLQCVATFLLECEKARKYIQHYPLSDMPWGPTQTMYNFNMRLSNQSGPVIVTWGGRRQFIFDISHPMLLTEQLFNANNEEQDHRNILGRDETNKQIIYSIQPPKIGYYKLMIFGLPKPKEKGKITLRLLASFLIDCKLTKQVQDSTGEDLLTLRTDRNSDKNDGESVKSSASTNRSKDSKDDKKKKRP
ncbi:KY (predicted) [Pycnogonum litorale]